MMISKSKILLSLVSYTSLFLLASCSSHDLPETCNCKLSGQEVFLDGDGEYYWIEIDRIVGEDQFGGEIYDFEQYGPYESESHGYAAIERCEELERQCKERNTD